MVKESGDVEFEKLLEEIGKVPKMEYDKLIKEVRKELEEAVMLKGELRLLKRECEKLKRSLE